MRPSLNRGLPALVGLTGYMGVGKNTVADLMGSYGYKQYGFADPLKQLAKRVGWDGTKKPWTEYPAGTVNGRLMLQELGVGAREIIGPDVWIDALFRRLEAEAPSHAVITDVRFPNEADAIRERGGFVVRVERGGYHGDGHISETQVDAIPVDTVIRNYGWKALYAGVAEMLRVAALP